MRLLDVSVSVLGIVFLSPLLLVLAAAVKLSSTGPALYRAQRVGKDGQLFHLYKFRTMVVGADTGPRITRKDDPRVTMVGRFLRRTKLDELPQLFNTLKGDMTLVGPRPEDPRYVKDYSQAQSQVLRVRPGITSLATLAFRHEERMLTGIDSEHVYREKILPEKLQIELDYLLRRSLATDLWVLARTAIALVRIGPTHSCGGRGAS
jgi:lipopolysaccharide/colanic/teichoic acid biosynthesis glycosyltransferase